mgnify:CR=1 FL=1
MKYLPISSKLYELNRARFVKKMKPNSVAIFPCSPVFPKSGDGLYGYKPDADVLWLSGVTQEKTIVVLYPDNPDKSMREVLVLHDPTGADRARFEAKLEQYRGNLERSAVELAKDWRTDRILRRLEAMLIVLDASSMFLLSGNGDLIEPDDGIVAIGSGGPYALAAAKALAANTNLSARDIAVKSMTIAGEICIYTNQNHTLEVLE